MNNQIFIIGVGLIMVLWTSQEAFKRKGILRYIYISSGLLVLISAISITIQDNSKTPPEKIQPIEAQVETPTQEQERTVKSVPLKKEIKMKKPINQLIEEKTNHTETVDKYFVSFTFMEGATSMYNEDTYILAIYDKDKVSPTDKPLKVVQAFSQDEFIKQINGLPSEFDFVKDDQ